MLDLDAFLGTWTLGREIDDRRAGMTGAFEGQATLALEGQGLRYREQGVLRWAGADYPATREFLWNRDGEGIAVRFADGRAFHRFVPEGRAAGTEHPCGADLYRVAYDFTGWPRWTAAWDVTGPAKDYRMVTDYARA